MCCVFQYWKYSDVFQILEYAAHNGPHCLQLCKPSLKTLCCLHSVSQALWSLSIQTNISLPLMYVLSNIICHFTLNCRFFPQQIQVQMPLFHHYNFIYSPFFILDAFLDSCVSDELLINDLLTLSLFDVWTFCSLLLFTYSVHCIVCMGWLSSLWHFPGLMLYLTNRRHHPSSRGQVVCSPTKIFLLNTSFGTICSQISIPFLLWSLQIWSSTCRVLTMVTSWPMKQVPSLFLLLMTNWRRNWSLSSSISVIMHWNHWPHSWITSRKDLEWGLLLIWIAWIMNTWYMYLK